MGIKLPRSPLQYCKVISLQLIKKKIKKNYQGVELVKLICVGSDGKNSASNAETWVQSLGGEDPLGKGKATHSSILAWRIPRTEEPGGL